MSVKELSNGTWEVSVYLPGGRRFRWRYSRKKISNDVFNQVKAGIATGTLRKVLQQMSPVEAMELLREKMSKTKDNEEFLKSMAG